MTAPLNPEPRTPSPRLALPPSPRDFEIHRLSSIELLSTRKIAGQFKISQTRVRQIVEEVSRWLAEKIPFATDVETEREKRLAFHLAAAQLRHQVEQLQELWTDSKDTKYLRQQTRCILALARLGIIPGTLDALAADAECGIGVPPVQYHPAPIAENDTSPVSPPLCAPHSQLSASSPIPNPKSEIGAPARAGHLQSEILPPPPSEDCSPKPAPIPKAAATTQPVPAPTPWQPTPCDEGFIPKGADLNDLNLIEQHLLTVLDRTPLDKAKNREVLNQALAEVRHKRACFVLELAPNAPAVLTIPKESPTSGPWHPATESASSTTANCQLPSDK